MHQHVLAAGQRADRHAAMAQQRDQHRGQHRDADRTAEHPRERGQRRGDTDLLRGHRVLRRDQRARQLQADRQTEGHHHDAGQHHGTRIHEGQRRDRQRRGRGADQLQWLVAPAPCHQPARDERPERDRQRQRHQPQRRAVRLRAADHLETQRQQHRHRDQLEEAQEQRDAADRHRRHAQHRQWNHRIGRAALLPDEQQQRGHATAQQAQRIGAPDIVPLAQPRQEHQHAGQSTAEQQRAQIVDPMLAAATGRQMAQRPAHREQRQQGQRQVDPEDPAPRQIVGQVAADHRSRHAGDRPHAADIALIAAALAQRHHVGNRRLRHRDQPPAAEPLQDARDDQLRHRLRECARDRREQEQHDRERQHRAPAQYVGQLAVDRRGHRRRDQVGRHDPGHHIEAVQAQGDLGQDHGHDRLLERTEQDRQHQAENHLHHRDRRRPGRLAGLNRLWRNGWGRRRGRRPNGSRNGSNRAGKAQARTKGSDHRAGKEKQHSRCTTALAGPAFLMKDRRLL